MEPSHATPTLINLTANATYTAAAGDYAITGLDGNDTITTGAGNSSVTTGTGNSTITTGAGDSLVHTLDGNQTITTGAGNSTVITGAGNSTITTGAGINTVQAGNGNNTITTGAGASHITTGTGNDTITSGAGDAVVDSGIGNDTVTTGAGNDLVSYHVTDNAGTYSLFTAAAGIDTLNLVMTRAEWMSDAMQSDVASYLDFLAANKGASGEDGAASYAFKAFGLTASMFENLQVTVDGVVLQDATNHTVALLSDAISTTEKVASLALNVLANDAVPDLIKSFSSTNPEHGSVHLDAAYLATASAPSAQFIYTPTPGYYDYLALGESASDAFTYSVTDAAGGVNTATVSVTIIGTNDEPVITSAVLSGAVTEQITPAGNLTSSGEINFSDVDLSDVHTVTAAAASSGTLGTLTASITHDDNHTTGLGGQVSWAYSVADSAVEYLAAGQTKVETFIVSLDDGHGGVVPSTVSVTITGTNDAPLITSSAQAGAVQEDITLTASGTVTSSDVDHGATATYTGSTTGTYGSFAVTAGTGAWTYTLDNAHHQNLAQGESHTETFLVTVTDDKNATATQNVVLTITGTNDAPVIGTAVLSGAVTEQITPAVNLTSSGAINFSDVDLSDSHTVSAVAASSGTLGTLTAIVSTDDSHTTGLGGQVTWNYSVDNSKVQYLALGESKVEIFTVTLNDGHGGLVPSTVSVTITGTNDAPMIGTAVLSGAVTEQITPAGNLTSSGAINFSDLDLSDSHTVSAVAATSGTLGTLTAIVSTDDSHTTGLGGVVTWAYSVADSAVEYLAEGQTKVETFTVSLSDGHGGVVPSTVSVTITGTNDAAVLSSAVVALTETNAPLTTSGTLTITDVDSPANFVAQTATVGTAGTFSINTVGAWTFTANSAFDSLNVGAFVTNTFSVAAADGTLTSVKVTITGTNDAPVMTGTMTDPLYAATNGAWGTFTNASGVWIAPNGGSDGDTLPHSVIRQFVASQAGTYDLKFSADNVGSVSIDGIAIAGLQGFTQFSSQATGSISLTAGTHTIVMDVQNFGGPAGFALTAADPTGNVIWNTRTQLDPVALVVAYTENQAAQAISAGLTIADIDSTQLVSATVSIGNGFATGQDILGFANQNGISGSYNSASGVLGLSGSATVAQYQAALRSVSYSNSSESPSTAARTVNFVVNDGASQFNLSNTVTSTVIVRAVNDVPIVATTDVTGSVTELASTPGTARLTDSGTIAFSDADLTDIHSVSTVTPVAGALGTLTASVSTDSTGTGLGGVVTWNYSVADSAVEYLATGETKVETFSFNVLDGQGGSVARTITMTITGTNDAPVIGTAMLSGAVTEQVTPAGNLTSSGAINFSDVDLSDVHTVSAVAASSGTLGTLTASVSTDTNHTTGLGGVVTWVYSVDNAKVQYLAAGQTKVETFTVSLNDGHGSVVPSTVSVTITGTNNAPIATNDVFNGSITGGVMTFEAGTYSGTYGAISAGGFNFSNGANSGLFVHGDTYGTNGSAALFSNGGPGPNMYMTHADGHAFSLQSANITSITDSYYSKATEVVTGYLNGVQVAQQAFAVPNYYIQNNNLVTFTASGFNAVDNVLFSAQGSTYQFIDTVNSGVIRPSYDDFNVLTNDTDIDNGSTLSIANFSAISTMGAAITLNANGTLHYDPTLAAGVQALAAGQAGTDTFTYVTKDEHGALSNTATVSVSVIGVNDAPVITSGAQTGSVSEGGGQPASSMTTTGRVTYSDVDLTDTHALSIGTLAAHGSASVNAQGNWSYTLTNDATVNALTTGQHLSDSFTVLVDDLHGGKASQVVSIDITNIKDTNHAPVANPDSGVSINSNGSVPVSFTPIGSAYQNGTGSSEYVITQELNNQVGALWSNSKVSLDKSFSVSAQLYFGTNDYYGADGFSFIVQNQSKAVIGSAGQGLGYAGITKSVGVEFDTYYNGGTTDIQNDHMNINTGGLMNAVGGVIDLGNIEDGKYHGVNIDWAASTKMLTIVFDNAFTKTQYVDMVGEVGSAEAYIGFAGSTGGAVNLQKINTLTYKSVDSSIVLDVLANDTDIDTGDKAGLKVISAASTHGATVSFNGLAGAGITYSPGHAFDTLAVGSTTTDTINYTIADSHGAESTSMATITIVGVAH